MSKPIVHLRVRDFKKVGRYDKNYRADHVHALTWTWPDKAKKPPLIELDSNMPKVTRYGSRWVRNHEMTHVKIADLKLNAPMKKWGEELYCDLEGLVRTPYRQLYRTERALKHVITRNRRWNHIDGRRSIIKDILRFLRIKLTRSQIEALVHYKDRRVVVLK